MISPAFSFAFSFADAAAITAFHHISPPSTAALLLRLATTGGGNWLLGARGSIPISWGSAPIIAELFPGLWE